MGLAFLSQGSPRIMFSFPQVMTWRVNFLGESLDVEEQITSVSDVTILVIGVVSVSGSYGDGEFLSREIVLLNEVSIDTGNVHTAVD